jgi:hypothetical protein
VNRAQALANADLALMDADELRGEADRLTERLGEVWDRIWELEEARGNPEERELRRDYQQSVL